MVKKKNPPSTTVTTPEPSPDTISVDTTAVDMIDPRSPQYSLNGRDGKRLARNGVVVGISAMISYFALAFIPENVKQSLGIDSNAVQLIIVPVVAGAIDALLLFCKGTKKV